MIHIKPVLAPSPAEGKTGVEADGMWKALQNPLSEQAFGMFKMHISCCRLRNDFGPRTNIFRHQKLQTPRSVQIESANSRWREKNEHNFTRWQWSPLFQTPLCYVWQRRSKYKYKLFLCWIIIRFQRRVCQIRIGFFLGQFEINHDARFGFARFRSTFETFVLLLLKCIYYLYQPVIYFFRRNCYQETAKR